MPEGAGRLNPRQANAWPPEPDGATRRRAVARASKTEHGWSVKGAGSSRTGLRSASHPAPHAKGADIEVYGGAVGRGGLAAKSVPRVDRDLQYRATQGFASDIELKVEKITIRMEV